tara:strand:+ start:250 stop:1452 length:1203 start_codon:yes stop_codon:yes gene_type:complete
MVIEHMMSQSTSTLPVYLKIISEPSKQRISSDPDNHKTSPTTGHHTDNLYSIAAGMTPGELSEALAQLTVNLPQPNRNIAFLFTGQGSQYHGMLRDLYQSSSDVRNTIHRCHDYLLAKHGIDCLAVLFGSNVDLINRTENTQPCLFMAAYTLASLWQQIGIQPDYLIGHSIGEIAAACFAGALDLESALDCVAIRARLMGQLPKTSGMVAVIADLDKTIECAQGLPIDIAGINHQKQTIVSGDYAALEQFNSQCQNMRIRTTPLCVSHGFHSRHMDPILDEFYQEVSGIQFKRMNTPIISTVSGECIDEISADYLTNQIRQSVNFLKAAESLPDQPLFHIEIGPQPILTRMIKKIRPNNQIGLASLNPKIKDPIALINCLHVLANQCEIDWDFVKSGLFS